jgi:hypothetical protein
VQRVKATKKLPQQVPLMLLNNIDDSFCLQKVECQKEHFDVCLCYRRDVPVDLKAATCIGEALRSLGKRVFREAYPGQAENIHIAKAVCSSSVFVLIISEHTFADINTLQEVAAKQPLANLFQQMEMMLETYENCSDYVRVLPVYVGDEVQEPVSLELHIKGVEGRLKCWPAIEQQKLPPWNSMVRQMALKQLRLFNVRIASLLHDRNLDEKLGFPPNTTSLVRGRDVENTMKIFATVFKAVVMNGRKEDEGKRVCETVKLLLEDLETNRGRSDLHLGKTSASSHHDAGEGSSSGVKRQIPDQASAQESEQALQVSSEGATCEGATSSIGAATNTGHEEQKCVERQQATDARRCRVFLSYRVASDADLVERRYYRLRAESVDVWWDKRC